MAEEQEPREPPAKLKKKDICRSSLWNDKDNNFKNTTLTRKLLDEVGAAFDIYHPMYEPFQFMTANRPITDALTLDIAPGVLKKAKIKDVRDLYPYLKDESKDFLNPFLLKVLNLNMKK
ncbi:hypothetical protein J6590_088811 [Homalodisca vitripennis]|nr:hypothetical protein J6590_088811 [Homalodisca vitripennis]